MTKPREKNREALKRAVKNRGKAAAINIVKWGLEMPDYAEYLPQQKMPEKPEIPG